MKYNLAGKLILIVDDYASMRKSVRDMLYTLGANKVFEADNAATAITTLQKRKFDIVLCDHNLGAGKNGQQLLEEIRHRKLLDYHSIFFMISAEHTTSRVLGVIDCRPDEYLAKPFNALQLYTRLHRHFTRKNFLQKVEREIHRGNLLKAIEYCDSLLSLNDKRMQSVLLKLRAELAINTGDFAKAQKIYREMLLYRDLPWAKLGLGIIEFQQNNIEKAVSFFEQLVKEQPTYMEAYDWLCKAYELLDRLEDEQTALHQAVDLSPQSFLRQKKLAVVAEKNGDWEQAENAYKALVNIGKHSIYKSCSDYSGLARVYIKTDAKENALSTLAMLRSEFEINPVADLWAATLETELYTKSGQIEQANQAKQLMLSLHNQLNGDLPNELQLDVIKTCFVSEEFAQADNILNSLIKANIDDEIMINDIRRMQNSLGKANHSEKLINETKRKLIAINNEGVALYEQGRLPEAVALFEQAILTLPDNKTIMLNLLKITIQDLLLGHYDDDKLLRVKTLIKKAEKIGVDAHKLGILKIQLAANLHKH